jgi:hypothetical protein
MKFFKKLRSDKLIKKYQFLLKIEFVTFDTQIFSKVK